MISVTMLTKNSSVTLPKVLDALSAFHEIIILDTGSTDDTMQIAESYPNTKIHSSSFTSFGELRNQAADLASNEWILAIDSDEVFTDQDKLLALELNSKYSYSFPFHNFSRGTQIKHCGWHKERHTRLYNKNKAAFNEQPIHEKLQTKKTKKLRIPIHHFSYNSISDYLVKLELYTTLFARKKPDKQSSFTKAILHSYWAFVRAYILKLGFLDGFEGYLIAKYMSDTAFYKHLKLLEEKKCS